MIILSATNEVEHNVHSSMSGVMDMVGYRQTLNLSHSTTVDRENSSNTTGSESCDIRDDVETAAILVCYFCQ